VSEKTENEEKKGISRREFLKDAGLVVGGATVGSMAFLNSCKSSTAETVTVTSPPVTITATAANKYVDPIDNTEHASAAALKAHFNAVHPNADTTLVTFTVNGVGRGFQVKPYWSLARVLRDNLGLFALKEGCNLGECGTCTVLVDGQAMLSCMLLAVEMEDKVVLTVEGLGPTGVLAPLQKKFYELEAHQCGFCTPGFIMVAQGLLNVTPKPTLDQVRLALSGHVCMCGNMHRTVNAIVGGV
jgi:carbon-monoxide dehydrogenase small subunit